MGTSKKSKGRKGSRKPQSTARSVEEFFAYIRRQSREFDLALGAELAKVRQPDHRREQSVQGSEHQEIQGDQEAPEKL